MGTVSGKTKTKMEGRRPEGHDRVPGNTRMEETSRRQRRMEASSEGDQGPRRGCGTTDGWMDGHCQWENQDQDGRTSSGRTQQRSWEYENGEDEKKAEKNGGVFGGRPGPQKGLWHYRWMDGHC